VDRPKIDRISIADQAAPILRQRILAAASIGGPNSSDNRTARRSCEMRFATPRSGEVESVENEETEAVKKDDERLVQNGRLA
jgi:hypothetical protein